MISRRAFIGSVAALVAPLAWPFPSPCCSKPTKCFNDPAGRLPLAEFARADARIHLWRPDGVRAATSVGELLPLPFGPDTLGR
jgi:hypothetical protein